MTTILFFHIPPTSSLFLPVFFLQDSFSFLLNLSSKSQMESPILDKAHIKQPVGAIDPFHQMREMPNHSPDIQPGPIYPFPLIRLWERCSACRIDGLGRTQARLSRFHFTPRNHEGPAASHVDTMTRADEPHKSFISELKALWSPKSSDYLDPPRTLTAINPNARIEKGLPMENIEWEMLRYNVHNPYGKEDIYHNDACLCKWELTPDQIVGHWDWATLVENSHWYEAEILPAFEDHNNFLLDRSQRRTTSGVSNLGHVLPKSLPKALPKALSKAFMASSLHKVENTTSTSYIVGDGSSPNTSSTGSDDGRVAGDMNAGYFKGHDRQASNYYDTDLILNKYGAFPQDDSESTGYVEEENADFSDRGDARYIEDGDRCFRGEEPTSYLGFELYEGFSGETDDGYIDDEDCGFSGQGDDGYDDDD
jgi:hypothetical protein